MFTLKKIIALWFAPLPISILLLIIAFCLFTFTAKKRLAFTFNLLGLSILMLSATPWVANSVIESIEVKHVYRTHQEVFAQQPNIAAIVVLGCGHKNTEPMPITSQLAHCSLARAVEGIRIAQYAAQTKLIFTGWGGNNLVSNAEMNTQLALDLGIKKDRILTFSQPKDTAEEAIAVKNAIKNKPIMLVTEASHMPRAIKYFERVGLEVYAMPTRHLTADLSTLDSYQYAPNSKWIEKSERAIYERLALVKQLFDE
ncbi:ElyC/SanA/YdcF family protein [Algibacillus agarilyticus]|uniref:ElyC/SanA/YdcF family protein n=1 Tax=Algibacillus agarilyticus TaxID=2234133 RepID=UPI000DD06DB9|nr:ElyC/SanA/YdcF family protein [Algibacillus agarilyticus]